MKNLFKLFVPAAVAALALVSCNKEQNYEAPEAVTIRVHATANDLKAGDQETKTYIDNTNTIIWGTGEYMKLALTAGETTTFANSTDASADIFNGDPEAMFEFSVTPESASEYVYQGLYPASAAAPNSNTNAANYKVNLPAIQNATASSYDPAAYIMVAKPETFTSVQTDWEASFRRGTALNKITLKNFGSSVSINKVKITATGKKLAGGRHFNLTTGEGLEVYGTDATIEVLYATPLTGTSMDIWFTSWEAEIAESETLTIVAYTTDNKSYTKEITVPAGKSIKFREGYLNTTGVSMSGISPVTVSSLDGDYVILAKKDDSTFYALKGEASGTRIASVDYSGSLSNYSGDVSLVWTIASSGTGYTIKNGGNFIGWNGGSGSAANNAALFAEADYDADKCLMGIDDNGDGTYKIYVAAETGRILARNQSNAYFAFYGNTQYKDIVLVPATALEQVATPTFDPAAGEVTSGTNVSISCATSGATIHYTVDGTDPTSSSATYSSPIEITATTTIKAIAVKDGMADSEVAAAQYTVPGSIAYDFETVAELNALVTSTSTQYSGYLTDAVVSFVPATNTAIVKDATGSVMIYKSGHGLKQGQTYTGAINVTAIKYNSLYSEITVWDATFTGAEATVSPESVSLADLIGNYDDYQNAYVQVAGLTVSSVDGKNIHVTDGANSYVVYDNTSSVSVAAGDVITAIGTITKYQTTEEIKVWKAADVTVTASAPKAITFSQPAAGGSFTVKVDGNTITSGTTVAAGKTVTLTATPATDYEFTSWTVTGATVVDASAATTTFTMENSPVTVSASFTSTGGGNTSASYTYEFESQQFSATGPKTLNSVSWTLSGTPNYYGFDSTNGRGQQFGSKNKPATNAILTTSGISGTISTVKVSAAAYSTSATLTVSVGGTVWDTVNLTSTNAEYTFTGTPTTGTVVITLTNPATGGRALYIKKIVVQ